MKYSKEEIEYITNNYLTLDHETIGKNIGRSRNSIRNFCYENNLRKQVPDWVESELAILRDYYSKENIDLDGLAVILKRHKTNICRKAKELGLSNKNRHKSPEHADKIRNNTILWIKEHGHVKGYLGHKHSAEAKLKMSEKSKKAWSNPDYVLNSEKYRQEISDRMVKLQAEGKMRNSYSRGSMGKREDLGGLYVRSSWEANYARYLNWLVTQKEIQKWEYEPDTFIFEKIQRGTRSYLPDFKITNNDGSIEYHEVKGWMDQKSKTKLSRMEKYYPEVKLILIGASEYNAIKNSVSMLIPNWEYKK